MKWTSVIVMLTIVVSMTGCERSSKSGDAIGATGTRSGDGAASPVVLPTALPDLSGMATAVQQQLRAQYDLLTGATSQPGTTKADLAAAYGGMGKLLLAAGAYAAAEPYLLNARTLAADDFRWSYYLAHVYRLEGESAKAAAFFEQTIGARPDEVAALVWLGDTYLDQGRADEAGPLFSKALAKQPRAAAALVGLGKVALQQHDYPRAIDQLERALEIDRRATAVRYPLAMAYRATGKIEQADAQLRQRGEVEIGPPDPLMQELLEMLHSAVAFESRGDRSIAGGEYSAAVALFRRGLELAPESVALRQKLATALSLTGDVAGALKEFKEVLRRSPDFAQAHYSLGVLLLGNGQLDPAIDRFATAAHSDPTFLQARLQLANTLRRRGRFESSVREYLEVIKMDPRVGEARLGEAVALAGQKRYREARDRLRDARRLFPNRLEFVDALSRLYATAPDAQVRDGGQARTLAEDLVARRTTTDTQETMAMALAEAGEFEAAVRWQRDAIAAAERAGRHDLAVRMAENLRLYERRLPCRTAWRDDPVWDPT